MNLRKLLYSMGLPMFLLFSLISIAQDRVITGAVTDPGGKGIPGVSVTVKGQARGTTTKEDGGYSLSVPSNATTLVFSSVGYGSQEVAINGKNSLNVTMTASANSLNEVVVIGYGTRQKKDLTGSVTSISSKDFQKGQITTPDQLITGKVAGVQIASNGGAPGSGSTIRIRGGASLNASNDPLYVIDGVPIQNPKNPDGTSTISGAANPLSLINPNDIESMTVLKDASATAIYGARASNGVIIITTKKGRSGKPVFNFNTQVSLSYNPKEVAVLNANQFRDLINQKGNDAQKALLGTANTDWQKQIYQTAVSEDNNLSVTGALKSLPYRLSAGYLNQEGILKTGSLQRKSLALNLSPKLFDDHLRIDLNLKGAITNNSFANESAIGAAAIFDPTQPIYSGSKRYGGYFEWLDPSTGLPNTNAARNPLALLMMRTDKSDVKRSIGNAQIDYKFHFLPDLHANVNVGYDIAEGKGNKYISDSSAEQYLRKGTRTQYKQTNTNKLLEAYLNYAKDLNSISSRIDVLAGYSYQDFLINTTNFPDVNAVGDTITKPTFPFNKPQNTLISFYGRLNYSFKGRYLLTATLRRDGSSRFAENNRWGLFPAGAFAWNMKDESFLKDSRTLSQLKLRLGYGITGQQEGIANYIYLASYALSNQTAQYQLGNTFYNMYRPAGYNPNIKWEQTATANAGFDFGFLDNRISGSIDVYQKKTKDLLSEINQPAGTNFSNRIIANVGKMENKGVELSINTQPIRNRDLTWDVNFNATYNTTEITNLTITPDPNFVGNQVGGISGGTGSTIQINTVGYPRNAFYVYQQVYDAGGKPIEGVFVDRNGDGTINERDLYQYKNIDPKFFLGFSTNVNYKKWNGGFVLRANVGNYVYNNIYSNLGRYNVVYGLPNLLNNASVNILETGFSGSNINQLLSDYYVQNASFLKMDNIYVGYNFGKLSNNSRVNLRINGTVQNVFTITKYKGLDPEIASGIDNNFYPRPRTFVLGLNLGF